ncbi:MAG: hypothetical protein K0S09_2329 [Sphingobacteriaceae bacterium]|jgi:uncharacterized protein (DUF2147 family)|nr:hypothetical protein [Sphingobacteriaceae bacterium]
MFKKTLLILFLSTCFSFSYAQKNRQSDQICGKWISEDNNLIVQVYKQDNEFKGKIVWFDDPEEDRDINLYYDIQNPNPSLRKRKLLGLNVLEDLQYDSETGTWENGTIYDATSGKVYSSAICLNPDKTLKVTGYWKFKFIGRSMKFKRVDEGFASR